MIIVGIDEVGRGCWAGPLVAGAVILEQPISDLKDSKLLSKRLREEMSKKLIASGAHISLGWVSASEVDSLGVTAAVRAAMERALQGLALTFDDVIVDGNFNFLAHIPKTRSIIKADVTVPAVSAASIAAKVARDTYMAEQGVLYPEYGFQQHVGYGTTAHRAALQKHGLTILHRRSFKPVQALLH